MQVIDKDVQKHYPKGTANARKKKTTALPPFMPPLG